MESLLRKAYCICMEYCMVRTTYQVLLFLLLSVLFFTNQMPNVERTTGKRGMSEFPFVLSNQPTNQPNNQPQRKRCATFWTTTIGNFISFYFELCHEHLKSHLYSCVHFSLLNDGRHTIIYPFLWKWNEWIIIF